MHLKHLITALAAFSSIAAAAPAQDAKAAAADKGQSQDQKQNQDQNKNNNGKNNNNNNNNNKGNNNNGVTIVQNIVRPNIIVVQENLDTINQLQRQNERQLALLVQSQLALATQLQTVKDNIRINHFKAQFPQANTVIVTVTGLVDNRNQGNQNQRYLVTQLLADNGKPEQQTLVMVTDPTPLQISTQQAASSQSDAFGATRVALDSQPDAGSNNTDGGDIKAASTDGAGPGPGPDDTLKLAAFDQAAPFGQIGQSIILPAGTKAPQLSVSIPDPAAIILPNQQGLFVENSATFLSDCASSAANAAAGNPALAGAALTLFSSFQQIAAAQLAGLSGLGIFNNSGQGGQPLGAIAVGANQGAPPPPPTAPAAQPAPPPPAQVATPPPANAPAPAPAPPAAIVAGANQAQQPPPPPPPAAAAPPQGNQGSGVVVVGSNPGGAAATTPAAQPPAAVVDGANQAPAAAPAPAPPGSAAAEANQPQPPADPAVQPTAPPA